MHCFPASKLQMKSNISNFLHLTYFTQHYMLKHFSCCCTPQLLISSYWHIIFHYISICIIVERYLGCSKCGLLRIMMLLIFFHILYNCVLSYLTIIYHSSLLMILYSGVELFHHNKSI